MVPAIKPVFSIAVFLCVINACFAQDTSRNGEIVSTNDVHRRKTEFPPKAILVQLRSEQSRIQYFTSRHDQKRTEQVIKDAETVRKVMTNDFKDRFTFCPVYFFIDTNAKLVTAQKFDGVLFNADGSPAKSLAISQGDTDYFIVYYGYPENEKTELKVMPGATYKYGSGNVMGKGLMFLNYNYEQRDYYYVIHNFRPLLYRFLNHNYEYYSKKFDMEYRPFAVRYNEDLLREFPPADKTK